MTTFAFVSNRILTRSSRTAWILILTALMTSSGLGWSRDQEKKADAATPAAQAEKAKVQPPAKPAPPSTPPTYASAIANLKFREIGPANMGGRVDDFAVVESDPNIVYAGFASGGVWKTTNAGTTWEPLFDKEAVSTIGALAVAPSDPSIVWVGTGEVNNRQSSSWGNGVYKSMDAGRTWKNMGLADTQTIGAVAIHPVLPDIVYAAAPGHLWGPNKERGVYKTTDGGRSWKQALFINEDTGAVDLVMDPQSPETLYAASYQRRRTVFGFNGGGPGSAIYKTTDGGATWNKLSKGLPYENEDAGETGRIGLTIYRRNPSIIYATIEHSQGGIFRSEDKGETWKKMSPTQHRPMYYSRIYIDPANDLRVWMLGAPMLYSEDGGKTFRMDRVRRIHGDYHAMWINPRDSRQMIVGSDGGVHWSYDAGKSWDFVNTIAVGQFYEIGYDMRRPYRVYGGLQDNGNWTGPSRTLDTLGITNEDWHSIGGGDGFYVQVDPQDPDTVYAESQDGYLFRRDLRTDESRSIRPRAEEGEHLRFQWNSPILISAHDSKRLYYGAQFLYRSDDRGDTWTKISPDLTTGQDRNKLPIMGKVPDAKTRSRHDGVQDWPCITAIGESPRNGDVLWVGTDDGRLQVTRDGGKNWENVADRVPKLPRGTYVTRVVASRSSEGTAYAAFDGHRMNDFGIYVYATADYGRTWKDISAGLPRNNGVVNVIREHHRDLNLLFVGTEYGAFLSSDKGATWMPLKLNLPTVPVDDIAIHPRDNDLILGTHGRSIWILDDITPLEQLNAQVLASDVHVFDPRPATAWRMHMGRYATGQKLFLGPNPPYGAVITYYLKSKPAKDQKILATVTDASGKKIREIEVKDAEAGVNRLVWDLRYDPAVKLTPEEEGELGDYFGGGMTPPVEPGTYTLTVTVDKASAVKPVMVEDDPRIQISAVDRAERHEALMRLYDLGGRVTRSYQSLLRLKKSLAAALADWGKPDATKIPDEIKAAAEALQKKTGELLDKYIPPQPATEGDAGPPLEIKPPTVLEKLWEISGGVEEYSGKLTEPQKKDIEAVAKLVEGTGQAVSKLIETDLADLNKKINQAGILFIRAGKEEKK
jgi:photosystem II stability/assembly factor-like uncharacterized protein